MAWGLHRSFAFFNTKGRNPRWSWSAISEDGGVVAVTQWDAGIVQDGDYVRFGAGTISDRGAKWTRLPGNRERLEYLRHAVNKLEGIIHPVITVPKDRSSDNWAIGLAWPVSIQMRIVKDSLTDFGAFEAISVVLAQVEQFRTETWPR